MLEITFQNSLSPPVKMTEQEKVVVLKEIEKILKKEAIIPMKHDAGQFLSSIFIVPKKSHGFSPVVNLEEQNSCVEYKHFKMEELFLLNKLLKKDHFLCKLDLKDA